MRVRYLFGVTVPGEVVSVVVRSMACDLNGDRVLSRFDTAHGTAHQDLLTPGGTLREKNWYAHLTFDETLHMRSTPSKRTTKITRVKHRVVTLSAGERKGLAKNLPELQRYLKRVGAVPVSPAMKRRLIAAGAWGMPDE